MKRSSNSFSCALIVVLLALALVMGMVEGANLSPGQCKEERRLIINTCKPIVFGQSPSAACCVRVRVSHFECGCSSVDAKLAALISLDKVIKTLQTCGRAVPRRFKCGSIYFP